MKKLFSTLCAALAAVVCFTGCAASGYTVFEPTAVFADDILFSAKMIGGRARYAYERMAERIAEIDSQVSPSRADSDINALNAAEVGTEVEVGKYCYELFLLGRDYYILTDGAFNIAAAPLSELWHVDASSITELRPGPGDAPVTVELPEPQAVEAMLSGCDPTLVDAEERGGRYYLKKNADVRLDLGGIAKGYAVDRCVDILREYDIKSALIDISGNAYFYGDNLVGGRAESWKVGVLSPRPRGGEALAARGYVAAFSVGGGAAAATSGDYMRYYVSDNGGGMYVPHIIKADGVPVGVEYADGQWRNSAEWVISATVIADGGAASDALSTAVCALGMEKGARLLQKVGCKGLIFTEKRFTIIGGVELYKPDVYDGYRGHERVDFDIAEDAA